MKSTLLNGNGQHLERGPTRLEMIDELIADARIWIHEKYGATPRYDPEEFCMHRSGCRCHHCYTTEEIAELIDSGDLTYEQIATINDYRPRPGETVRQVMERCALC